MKILLAVDGSAYTKKMLAYLAAHDGLLTPNHDYHLLTVQPELPPRARAALGKEAVTTFYAEESDRVLKPVETHLARRGIASKRVVKTGSAGQVIANVAQAGAYDLVVMGSHGKSALGNLIIGSVATKVLAECKVPVLIVR
ncbi:nucleotide-binding universal stress UspA family protein [Comamonas sp. BIGb0124]|uniref:universal stress protein n=1 Tax=Comamonas sp. BIGb0124 TaxID=2485130 RepID=UPI000F48BE0A|nr:universal stress protein [Comamonas sp. BIGb0124]ROR23251.1 nucleotide-binding universal stress UspA family protein [Comamonas sp. BIGb0124]